MHPYQHILFAADLKPLPKTIRDKVVDISQHYQADVLLIHVVEFVPYDLANELVLPQFQEVEQQLVEHSKKELEKLTKQLNLPKIRIRVEVGSTKTEIIRVAEEDKIDLIIIGRQSRHGVSSLLGTTASAVLNRAPCDVLAVKVN